MDDLIEIVIEMTVMEKVSEVTVIGNSADVVEAPRFLAFCRARKFDGLKVHQFIEPWG
jgi:hypothetical protein